ncbi:hypothetical protein BD289DRAFT_281122 [Coniella lustricola]|uniref:Uncharacterized protein n=1 Tax=Coniella lustricola TaxID=2025994 RepID=A0A2T3A5W1_9PEZI|nr:hypothetical protein BD289DRAFT_281122 [Coniella lustricola]
MAPSAGNTNPFLLSDSEEGNYWARTKCRVPNCDKDALKGNVACSHHLSALSPKSMNFHVVKPPQNGLNGNSVQAVSEQSLLHNRKILEAKATARKSAATTKRYVPPAQKASVWDVSPDNSTTKTYVPGKMSVQRILNTPLMSPEGRAKKKQRTRSPTPTTEAFSLTQPPTNSRAFVYDKRNGGLNTELNHRLKSDRISPPPLARTAARLGQPQEKQVAAPPPVRKHSQTPWNSSSTGTRPDLPRPKAGASASTKIFESDVSWRNRPMEALKTKPQLFQPPVQAHVPKESSPQVLHASASYKPLGINKSPETPSRKTQPPKQVIELNSSKDGSVQAILTEVNGGHVNKAASKVAEPMSDEPVPLLEKQRRLLVERRDTSVLDSFIYGQAGSSQILPPGVKRQHIQSEPKNQLKVFMGHIDPRIHRNRPHSDAWYREKEEEIKQRGGRKANFGKAAQRMKLQRAQENPDEPEATLPDRVRKNEDWASALQWFQRRTRSAGLKEQPVTSASPSKTKRPASRQKSAAHMTPQKRVAAEGH